MYDSFIRKEIIFDKSNIDFHNNILLKNLFTFGISFIYFIEQNIFVEIYL